MGIVAPNLAALIGDTVGARLISKAGSLTSLAKCPASTVQILGAEKVRVYWVYCWLKWYYVGSINIRSFIMWHATG